MSDKDFNIDDIINDVNSKTLGNEASFDTEPEIEVSDDVAVAPVDNSDIELEAGNSDNLSKEEVREEISKEKPVISEKQDVKKQPNAPTKKPKSKAVQGFGEHKTFEKSDDNVELKDDKKAVKKKKKKKKSVNNSIFGGLILITIILTASLVLAVTGITMGLEYTGIGKSEDEITFNIPKNSSTDDIAQILLDKGIIQHKGLFKLVMKVKEPTVIAGDITLHPSMGYAAVIDELVRPRESYETVTITFQEGLTLLEVANMLQENDVCNAEEFLFEFNKAHDFGFEKSITDNPNAFYRMEGYFFPDTYDFYVGDSTYSVTQTICEHFDSKITDKMYKDMEKQGLTLSDVVTLASIVQWEANSAEDMPKVASVFLNRMNDSETFPSLQSDATSKYIKNVIQVIYNDDTLVEPYIDNYDTYECAGLPAGPVCNPGIEAINAVIYPEDTDYYYFCNNLETGESFFAKTLEQHEKNLKKAGLT